MKVSEARQVTMAATGFMSIRQIREAYRDGSLTPVDVVAESLERLENLEPDLNAVAYAMGASAAEEAERLTVELETGGDLGPLHGIPVAIKDIIDIRNIPTGFGSRVRRPAIAARDAEIVKRLREAGAIILGKTNLLEYAYGIAHPDIGQTNNPHDTGRTSGGSSGGSAAVVSAGIVPLAVGTDTGGSIRIPAAYCGIVGLKPSFGLVPLGGVFPLSWSLDHAGPIARSVEDAALMLSCLAGEPFPLSPPSVEGLRIGVVRYHAESPELTPAVARSFREALSRLEARGAIIRSIDIPELASANAALRQVLLPEASLIHAQLLAENPGGYAPRTRSQIEAGFTLTAVDYLRAQDFRQRLRRAVEESFLDVDVLLSPSVPFAAPIEDPEFVEDESEGEMLSSGFANMTGQPSICLPCGMDGHLPVGLQLTGTFGGDQRLLQIALGVEDALGAYRRPDL